MPYQEPYEHQVIKPNNEDGKIYPPLAINLEDKNHRVIYDNQMGITPLPLVKKDQSLKDYRLTVREVRPPDFDYLDDDFYGWDESEAHNSLAISLKHMYDFLDNVSKLHDIYSTFNLHVALSFPVNAEYVKLFICALDDVR